MSDLAFNRFTLNSGMRITITFATACVVTFLTFALMQQLIAAKQQVRPLVDDFGPITLFVTPDDPTVEVRPAMPKMTPPPERNLPKPQPLEIDPSNISPGPISLAPIVVPKTTGKDFGKGVTDRDATPLVRVEPRYPIEAARDGISGWVRLAFSINETGGVTDVEVIAAEPANLFNREAIKALKRWKYQPAIVNGVAIKQTNMSVQLDFSLQSN